MKFSVINFYVQTLNLKVNYAKTACLEFYYFRFYLASLINFLEPQKFGKIEMKPSKNINPTSLVNLGWLELALFLKVHFGGLPPSAVSPIHSWCLL